MMETAIDEIDKTTSAILAKKGPSQIPLLFLAKSKIVFLEIIALETKQDL